jgi:predicted PurR-regulated permease PerM
VFADGMAETAAPPPPGPYRPELREAPSGLATLAVIVVVVAALYFGRDILMPFALAGLLSFVLAPLAMRLRRFIGRIPSVIVTVVFAFLVIFGIGAVIASQLTSLGQNLPQYQRTIEGKLQALRGTDGGLMGRASTMLKELGREISKTPQKAADTAASAPGATVRAQDEQRPVPVEIRQPDPAPLKIIQNVIGPLLEPLATGGIVIIFVIFILLQREDIRDRVIRLAGPRDIQRTTQALDEAARRVSRYLLAQLIVNATYGIPIGLGLWAIGVPNPILWGIVAGLLRFIPYIGPWIAALFPLALCIAVDDGWSMLLWAVALFLVVELVSNNVVEPWLYGSATGLSAVAIIGAATFWTWLWGPIGLLLSTPLTSCLVVVGRHVPQLSFLDVVLGDEPVLSPPESFYQRVLAGDPDEAAENAETYLEDHSLADWYDEVALPGLALGWQDQARGALDEARRDGVRDAVAGVVENLSDRGEETREPLPESWEGEPVLCAAGRGVLDEAAAMLLADLLRKRGVGARVAPCEAMQGHAVSRLDVAGVQLVCLSYLDAEAFTHARFLVRRLRRRLPQARIVVGYWTLGEEAAARRDPLAATGADLVVTSLRQAVDTIVAAAREPLEARRAAE